MRKKQNIAINNERDDYQCSFSFRGLDLRCPESGAIKNSIGAGGKWLCIWHYRVQHDPAAGELVLHDLLNHTRPAAENWRDFMVRERIEAHRDVDPLLARAGLISEGKGDADDKLDLFRDLRHRLLTHPVRR